VFGGVMLAGLFGVMRGVVEMALRYVSMMAGLLMIARLVVFGCGGVMLRGVFVVLRGFAVVLRGIFRHVQLSLEVWSPGFSGDLALSLRKNCDVSIDGA
jgi:hypothetical protein